MSITEQTSQIISKAQRLLESGCYSEVMALLDEALAKGIVDPDVFHLKGLTYSFIRDFENAIKWIARAIDAGGERWLYVKNLGVVNYHQGNLDLAVGYFDKAIGLAPNDYETYGYWSDAQKFTERPQLLNDIERILANGYLNNLQRSNLHFAAAKIYDDIGETDQAFRHYLEANNKAARPADMQAEQRQIHSLIAAFTPDFFKNVVPVGLDGQAPVFVVGMPRSGTSLLEQMISAHPLGRGVGEISDFDDHVANMDIELAEYAGYPLGVEHVRAESFKSLARDYSKRVSDLAGSTEPGLRIVNSLPLNFKHMGLIAHLYPRARIIHIRRDPRDTCLSCFFTNFVSGLNFTYDLESVVNFYGLYEKLMNHWERVIPDRFISIDYEDLVRDTTGQGMKIMDYLGLEWNDACASPQLSPNPMQSASAWQVRQPVYTTSIGRWKKYRQHIQPILNLVEPSRI